MTSVRPPARRRNPDDRVPLREVGGTFFRDAAVRNRVGGASLAFLILMAPGMSGCTASPGREAEAPSIDMSSEESAMRTMARLQQSLTPQELNEFNQATLMLVRQEIGVAPDANQLDPQRARVAVKKVLDGRTAAEVIAAAKPLRQTGAVARP